MFHDPNALPTLALLVGLELVLGWDNILVVTILAGGAGPARRRTVTFLGLSLALLLRIAVLAGILRLLRISRPVFASFSPGDLAVIAGGAFLIYKAVVEIHREVEHPARRGPPPYPGSFTGLVLQIALLDLVFSVDSIAAAVGLTTDLAIMSAAILISFLIVLFASQPVGRFIERNPTLRLLCLAFLLCIGASLLLDGFHQHFPRGYLYGPMAFALLVEALQHRRRRNLGRKRPG